MNIEEKFKLEQKILKIIDDEKTVKKILSLLENEGLFDWKGDVNGKEESNRRINWFIQRQ